MMNRSEYYNSEHQCNYYYRQAHKLLKDWKIANGIPTRRKCVVHHRDDTEECIKYNEEYYELWGFNLDGTFEYGKYVTFMLNDEHTSYHHKGKLVSAETKARISKNHADVSGENNPMYGNIGRITGDKNPMRRRTVRDKVSKALKGRKISDETKAKMSDARKGYKCSDETKEKMKVARKAIDTLWFAYKSTDGALSYREFRKAFASGEITVEELLNFNQ